jgi:hypothetical protein
MELVDVTVWVLVDENGDAVSDCDPSHLKDEYEADIGELDPATATRLVKVTLRIPKPKPIELAGTVPAEVCEGSELRVA